MHVLEDADEFKRRSSFFADFYAILKKCTDKFRFIFVTGVCSYKSLGGYEWANNVTDISFEPFYAAIAGFTQKELERNFRPYIANASKTLRKLCPDEGWNIKKVLDELHKTYGGYSFDLLAQKGLYNPLSVIKFFANPEENFKPYWLDDSKSALLKEYFDRMTSTPAGLSEMMAFLNNAPRPYSHDNLTCFITDPREGGFPPKAVLFQAGYLTIKEVYYNALYIGIPNREARIAFANAVFAKLTEDKNPDAEDDDRNADYMRKIGEPFETKNLPAIKAVMNKMINGFSYRCIKKFDELAYGDVLGNLISVLTMFHFHCCCDIPSAKGRADLHLLGEKLHYIIEIKLTDDPNKADELFKKGKEQFLDRKCADLPESQTIVPCVMVIVDKSKRDDNIKEGSPTMLREVVRLEELPLTEDEFAKLRAEPARS